MRVLAIVAITVNGFISQTEDQISWDWTTPEDRKFLVKMTKEAGTVVLGAKTFDTFKRKRAFPDRRTIIYTTHPELLADIPGIETTSERPKELVARLTREGATGLAVLGGRSVYDQFLADEALDELYLTIEPIVFGGGIPLFGKAQAKLKLLDSHNLNENTIVLHYAVKK